MEREVLGDLEHSIRPVKMSTTQSLRWIECEFLIMLCRIRLPTHIAITERVDYAAGLIGNEACILSVRCMDWAFVIRTIIVHYSHEILVKSLMCTIHQEVVYHMRGHFISLSLLLEWLSIYYKFYSNYFLMISCSIYYARYDDTIYYCTAHERTIFAMGVL